MNEGAYGTHKKGFLLLGRDPQNQEGIILYKEENGKQTSLGYIFVQPNEFFPHEVGIGLKFPGQVSIIREEIASEELKSKLARILKNGNKK